MVSSRHHRPLGARQNHGIWHRIGYMNSNSRATRPQQPEEEFSRLFQPNIYLLAKESIPGDSIKQLLLKGLKKSQGS
ncbi:hypothetical protein GHT06_016361 [Daphnia sinensis]|uniref:Uncharacterized protein n=1 Tax=Daphnia sinensis TaxID=1820382 RepID=A0AAD5L5S0_9CRUS|nr:hypothetical protein GHT06_016361 [Daphnia sinensis]